MYRTVTTVFLLSIPVVPLGACPPVQPPQDLTQGEIQTLSVDDGLIAGSKSAGTALTTFSTDLFSGSGVCAACHSRLSDTSGRDVSFDTHWRSTMMANAANDPLFLATVADEVAHFAELQGVIEQTCATCHMPMARTHARVGDFPATILDGGFLSADHPFHAAARDGVSCALCHQIQADNLGEAGSFSGGYVIDHETPRPDRLIFGPFADPDIATMLAGAQFTPAQGAHVEQSTFCATCHTLYTPTVNEAGEIAGSFPEQVAFLEWGHSSFGPAGDEPLACQGCHMPAGDDAVPLAWYPTDLVARAPLAEHHFAGGNAFMLKLLRDNVTPLGLSASSDQFRDTAARGLQLLRGRAELEVVSAAVTDGQLTLRLRVTNNAGHKFPTGFPSRRAWLHVTVTNADGQTVFESGAPDAEGRIIGNDADEDAAQIEPHYDVITSADQVQIYEPILADTNGAPTYVLLRAAGYAKDNRLLPPGFDKTTAGDDFAVRGNAATDATFVGGSDEIEYRITLPAGSAGFTVTTALLFESVSYRYVAELLHTDAPRVDAYGAMHSAADKTPTTIAALQFTLE